jgi:hypothetical protein
MKAFLSVAFTLMVSTHVCAQSIGSLKNPDFSSMNPPKNKPEYQVTVTAETPYLVFINDIPLMSSTRSGRIKFPVNSAIRSSGTQKIHVVKQHKNAQGKQIEVSVQQLGRLDTLWSSKLKNQLKADGVFQAAVPYKVKDWTLSVSISEQDKKRIEKANVWFKKMAAFLQSGKGDAFMNHLLAAEMLTFNAHYFDKSMAIDYHEGWKNYINKGGIKVADLKSSRAEIVGNGKLLHLVNDIGEGALAILHGNRKTIFDIFLHFDNDRAEPEAIIFNLVEY